MKFTIITADGKEIDSDNQQQARGIMQANLNSTIRYNDLTFERSNVVALPKKAPAPLDLSVNEKPRIGTAIAASH